METEDREMEDQSEVERFLADPGTYGLDEPVARDDTHISRVFLAGSRAYKLKRAVRLPYLDFSTRDRRHAACDEELRLNRLFAPELYRDVLPVVRQGGGLSLGGDGDALDWVVEMNRFPEALRLDRVLEAGDLTPEIVGALVARVAEAHRRGALRPDRDVAASQRAALAAVAETLRGCPGAVDDDALARWTNAIAVALDRARPLIEGRRHAGCVRECHGDLHLRNICLVDGSPLPFDALEFDSALSSIDVLYDLAFLLMDLSHRGRHDLAALALNDYLDRGDESAGLALLPPFLSLRAAIRAQAEAASGPAAFESARAYLDDALDALDPPGPALVAIGGFSGSGKSSLARSIAAAIGSAPGARILRSDAIRKRLWNVPAAERLPVEAYTAQEHERVFARLYDEAAAILRSGHAVIADAVFGRPEQRAAIARVAATAGVPFAGFWLDAAPQILTERVESRKGDVSDATVEVLRLQLEGGAGTITWPRLRNDGTLRDAAAAAAPLLAAAIGKSFRPGRLRPESLA